MAQPADIAFSSWPVRARPSPPIRPRALGAAETASFEAHPDAQFVVRASGELVAANRAGRELVAHSESVRVLGDRFVAGTGARMRSLCERIAASVRSQLASPEIEIPTGAQSTLAIRVLPLGASNDAALVLVREREIQPAGSAPERFAFTRAESPAGYWLPSARTRAGSIERARSCHNARSRVLERALVFPIPSSTVAGAPGYRVYFARYRVDFARLRLAARFATALSFARLRLAARFACALPSQASVTWPLGAQRGVLLREK
jgi:hypothetical protein